MGGGRVLRGQGLQFRNVNRGEKKVPGGRPVVAAGSFNMAGWSDSEIPAGKTKSGIKWAGE
ncbi:hypothetical protein LTR96_008676 [Exophiala xenobiotica]|nr:hypothetical protein LTR96_008676 [Exophiala xenobiotica]KAK5315699.1 hypothetical protein LTR93_009558 [Exophiala xenobiotica]KAK5380572.1 hypothetical protein LTS13_003431 [Exophiala xenobiotica]KAK5392934.1 hypothetical protein LTR79_009837 [Exophiala xenobiotica]KAK5411989.1 hypothetical protein LTR90_007550 [Exophiala xenobiotica]